MSIVFNKYCHAYINFVHVEMLCLSECVSWQSMPGSGPLTAIALYDDGRLV